MAPYSTGPRSLQTFIASAMHEVIVCGTGDSYSWLWNEEGCDVNNYISVYTASHPRGSESSKRVVYYLTILGTLGPKTGSLGCLELSVILCRLARCISHKTWIFINTVSRRMFDVLQNFVKKRQSLLCKTCVCFVYDFLRMWWVVWNFVNTQE